MATDIARENRFLVHYDGQTWSKSPFPAYLDGHVGSDFLAEDDGWAWGSTAVAAYDGDSWSQVDVPFDASGEYYSFRMGDRLGLMGWRECDQGLCVNFITCKNGACEPVEFGALGTPDAYDLSVCEVGRWTW
jgi:hypothetical protein